MNKTMHTPVPPFANLIDPALVEYRKTGDYSGPEMTKLTECFGAMAAAAYTGGAFIWSEYNREQWERFASDLDSYPTGRSSVFSCEPDGKYDEAYFDSFRAIFVGVPYGLHPYEVWLREGLAKMTEAELRALVTSRCKATS